MKRNILQQLKFHLALGLACASLGLFGSCHLCQAQNAPIDLPPGVQDVVKLARAGITEDIILTQIKTAGATYSLTADQIIYLSSQGVSQNVLRALMNTSPAPEVRPVPVPSTPPPIVTPTPVAPPSGPVSTIPPAPLAPAAPTIPGPGATSPVGFEYFREQLAPYGLWFQDPTYGWVWRPAPAGVDAYWRPYLDQGHWTYTDAGWCWQSDYPWGEIAFHYGRWHRGGSGWVWVPGYDWAPAWVTWRHSEGYLGWAPLPPTAVFRAGVGLEFGGRLALDVDFGLGWDAFCFVGYDHFWERNLHAHLLPRERVDFVFRHSVISNGYRYEHGRFFVEGLGRERVGGFTHREVRVEVPIFRDERIRGHVEMERRGGGRERR